MTIRRRVEPRLYSKILVPLDGSNLAELAARHAADISRMSGGHLIFLRVTSSEGAKEAAAYLDEVNSEAYYEELDAEAMVSVGVKPAERIVTLAQNLGVDLIVLSSHGRTGLARQVFGSVAEEVVRAATCPVTVVKARTLPVPGELVEEAG